MYNVRLANLNDIDKIMEIRWMATKLLKGNGIDQWQNEYPAPSDFKNDIDKNQDSKSPWNSYNTCLQAPQG